MLVAAENTRKKQTPECSLELVFAAVPTFLKKFKSLQNGLDTIASKTIVIDFDCPELQAVDYQLQLQRTLAAAAAMIREACSQIGLPMPPQKVSDRRVPDDETVQWCYRQFLKHVLELFKLMEDEAYSLLITAGWFRSNGRSSSEKQRIDQILADMERAIETTSNKLDAVQEECADPDDFPYQYLNIRINEAAGVHQRVDGTPAQ